METKSNIIEKFIYLDKVDEDNLKGQDKVDYEVYKNISKKEKINYLYNRQINKKGKYLNIGMFLFIMVLLITKLNTKISNIEWWIFFSFTIISSLFVLYFILERIEEKRTEKIDKQIFEKVVIDKLVGKMNVEEKKIWTLLCENRKTAQLEYLLEIENKINKI